MKNIRRISSPSWSWRAKKLHYSSFGCIPKTPNSKLWYQVEYGVKREESGKGTHYWDERIIKIMDSLP